MTLAFVLVMAALLLTGVALGYSRLSRVSSSETGEDRWWLEFDPSRYTVLTRLASTSDLRIAESWRGTNAQLLKRLRRCRAQAAGSYLREMKADFERLETVGRLMILNGTTTVEFRQELISAKLRFTNLWWRARVEFFLWQLGIGRFDPAALVASFDRFVAIAGPMQAASAEA